jgi:hypothetical protein
MGEVNMIFSTPISFDTEAITVETQTQPERLEIPLGQGADADAFKPGITQHSARRR